MAYLLGGLVRSDFPHGVYGLLQQAPTFTIVQNAGFDGALVLGKLLEQDDHKMGYDAAKGLFVYFVFPPCIHFFKLFSPLYDTSSLVLLCCICVQKYREALCVSFQ